MPRIMSTTFVLTSFLSFVSHVTSLASTDTITWGGDNSRTGYQTNHNMDPAVVGSSLFGQLFKTQLPGVYTGSPEQVFSQPLVYTPSDGIQYVYVATTQNNIYKLNAKTGAIVASRNLAIPFLVSDLSGCVDINPHVGVTSTGVIDPDTDTLYLTTKTYANQSAGPVAQGRPAGRYYLHAISVNDLSEQPNFPVNLEGTVARNNPIRSFNGGIQHQRPALLHSGQYIYAGFASHCVQYNFTGWIMGWDKTTGATVERYATEGAGVPNTTPGGGVWMSGGGLASDDAGSMFFATGNGYASQLSTIPVNGRNPPTALEEAAVHMTINDDGSLTIVDFFMPYEKTQLDGADRDLGTTPLELLPSQFSCGNYQRIGVVTGKSGKTYWLNLDDLGGYQNGPNKQDNIIQVYQNENSVYAGAGVYPLEGGYIYINVIQYPTHVFQFSCTNGVPSFTKVADSPTNNAYTLGTGHGTTTSLNDQPGTGLLWTSDVAGQNLRVYNAVPVNGNLTQIAGFNVPGTTKFTRPVFGDGRVYVGTTLGYFYGFGSPVNLPINCTAPGDFGTSNLNNATAAKTVTCTALIGVSVTNITVNGANFNITNLPTTPLQVAAGKTFSFQAYFNPGSVGILSSDAIISTTNNVAGYSTSIPVSFTGTGQSVSALLQVTPPTLAFQGAITGASIGGVNQSVIIKNLGNAPLNISTYQYSVVSETGPFVAANQTSAGPRAGAFTFIGLPQTIPGNSAVTVVVSFDTSISGNFPAYVNVVSNGGTKVFDVVGTTGSAPMAILEFQTPDGTGWVQYQSGVNFTFGNVTENTTRNLKMRLTNNATIGSSSLSVTVSKPPFGVAGIIGAANDVDLTEGTIIAPGQNATATLFCSIPKEQWNTDPYSGVAQWTMNLDDPNFGKQYIQFACGAVSEQAPPLQSSGNGLGLYRYTGCFKENNPGRQLKTQIYSSANNTEAMCIAACAAGNWIFCGTQYNQECWGGNSIPIQQVVDGDCNYPCAGSVNQICGGNGVGSDAGGSYISLFADSSRFNGNVSSITPTGPFTNPGVNGYNYVGCYTEATNARALTYGATVTIQTVASCVNACGAKNYLMAGVEYGGQCYCGNSLSAGSVVAPITDCSMACNDNATEYCGAGNRLDIYQLNGTYVSSSSSSKISTSTGASTMQLTGTPTGTTSAPTSTGPAVKNTVGSYIFAGCYTEATTGRALSSTTYAADSMTVESCMTFCAPYAMFGVEYGRECYCGNSLNAGSVLATNQADCSFPCPGDGSEYCGAGNRLQLYKLNSNVTSSSSSSASSSSSSSAPSSSASSSSSLSSAPMSAGTGTSSSSSTSSTTSAAPTGPTIVPVTNGYSYMGCYIEAASSGNARTFTGAAFPNNTNTIPLCAQECAGWTYFGAEYGRECYCGNALGAGSVLTKDSDCSMVCVGDSGSYCGAGNRLSVYIKNGTSIQSCSSSSSLSSTTSSSSSSKPYTTMTLTTGLSSSSTTNTGVFSSSSTSQSTSVSLSSSSSSSMSTTSSSSSSASPTQTGPAIKPTIGGFKYYACMTEATNARALSAGVVYNYTAMTLEMCMAAAPSATYWGVEYGGECYYGNSFNTGSVKALDTDCYFACPGNSLEYCGGGNRLSVYVKNGTLAGSASSSSSSSSSSSGSAPSTSVPQTSTTATSSAVSSTSSSTSATYTGPPVTSQGNVNFTYFSCVSEPSNARLLTTQVENNGTYMTIEKCLSDCYMYAYAGVEYGRECWCGNSLTTGYANMSDSQCSFSCPGNSSEFCGAGNRLNLYWYDFAKAARNKGNSTSH